MAEATGSRAVDLVDGASEPVVVLVWDEADDADRWTGRSGVYSPRAGAVAGLLTTRGRPTAAARLTGWQLRGWLARRGRSDLVLVGREALGIAPWARHHRGHRIWMPTAADADGPPVAVPPVAAGGPHAIAAVDLVVARWPAVVADPRLRWWPGFHPAPPGGRSTRPEVLAWGPPDRRHGADLLGRSLVPVAGRLRRAGAVVRWIAPADARLEPDEHADLDRAGVADLVEVVAVDDPGAELVRRAPTAAALVVAGRPGATHPGDEALVAVFRGGAAGIGQGWLPPADLDLAGWWRSTPRADVVALGGVLADAVERPARDHPTRPSGLRALLDASVPR